MKGKYHIKNFRVIDENGASAQFAPITIFTGCNSSGKSSLVKSLFMLNDFLSQIKKSLDNGEKVILENYKIDFSHTPLNMLGNFDNVCNKNSQKREITIAYETFSNYLFEDVSVELVFYSKDSDQLNNCNLKKISLWKIKDGTLIYSADLSTGKMNADFESIREDFFLQCMYQFDYDLAYYTLRTELSFDPDAYQMYSGFSDEYKTNFYNQLIKPYSKTFIQSMEERKAFEKMEKAKCIHFLPVLEELRDVKKEEAADYILEKYGNGDADYEYHGLLEWFFAEYMKDTDLPIPDFFYQMENEYLKVTDAPSRTISKILHPESSALPSRSYIFNFYENKKHIDFTLKKGITVLYDEIFNMLAAYTYQKKDAHHYTTCINNPYIDWGALSNNGFEGHPILQSKNQILFYDFVDQVVLDALTSDLSEILSYCGTARMSPQRFYMVYGEGLFSSFIKKYYEKKGDAIEQSEEEIPSYFPSKWTETTRSNVISDKYKDMMEPKYNVKDDEEDIEWFNFGDHIRIYKNEEEHKLITEVIKRDYDKDMIRYDHPNEFMNKWVKRFDLGDHITMDYNKEIGILTFRLHKSDDDEKGTNIADEGQGITQLLSTLLEIETAIITTNHNRIKYRTEAPKTFVPMKITLAMEEPECHLHPKLQSLIADMMVDAYKNYGVEFIVETHSEYIIRKLQLMVAKKEIDADLVSILYADKNKDGAGTIKQIGIEADGRLSTTFGPGFFDEADMLSMELLRNNI